MSTEPKSIEDRLDTTPLRFGKYRGKTPEEIAEIDPSYVVWMHANVRPPPCSRELAIACEQDERDRDEDFSPDELGDWGER